MKLIKNIVIIIIVMTATVITLDLYIDLRKSLINIFISIVVIDNIIITIDSCLKHVMLNEVMIYEKFKAANLLIQLLNEY